MTEIELKLRDEIRKLCVVPEKIPWEKICLLILSLLPPGKFASRIFVYNKTLQWLPLDPKNKKYLKSLSKSLHSLYKKRLIIRDIVDIDEIGIGKFKKFCDQNKEGVIREKPLSKKGRAQLVFRLPKEGENVRVTIPQEKIIRMISKQSSTSEKGRAQLVFRLPIEEEKVGLTIPQEKMIKKMLKQSSIKKK